MHGDLYQDCNPVGANRSDNGYGVQIENTSIAFDIVNEGKGRHRLLRVCGMDLVRKSHSCHSNIWNPRKYSQFDHSDTKEDQKFNGQNGKVIYLFIIISLSH